MAANAPGPQTLPPSSGQVAAGAFAGMNRKAGIEARNHPSPVSTLSIATARIECAVAPREFLAQHVLDPLQADVHSIDIHYAKKMINP